MLGNYVYAQVNLFFLGAKYRAVNVSRVLVLIAIGALGPSQDRREPLLR